MRDPQLLDGSNNVAALNPESISYTIFMGYVGGLAFFVAAAYYLLPGHPVTHETLRLLDTLFALIFLLDFFIRVARAPDRSDYLWPWGSFDLLTSIPGLPFLRLLRALRLIHMRRRLADVPAALLEDGRARLAQSTFLIVSGLGLLILTAGTLAITWFEAEAPGATITTGGDALWWALVTVSTVGYGDLAPVTAQGRVIGAFMIVLGVALFTVMTSVMATIFIANRGPAGEAAGGQTAADQTAALNALSERIAALEALLRARDE
jgi:voltage-gated potassium channel